MTVIRQIILSASGAALFSVTLKLPYKYLFNVILGAFLSSSVYIIIRQQSSELIACTVAMILLSCYCELTARALKIPAIIILMPSAIPLLPGSYIFYTMLYAIEENYAVMGNYAKLTAYAGIGISLGCVINSLIFNAFSRKSM